MEPRTLQFLADASGGRLLQGVPETLATGLSTDTRNLLARDLYVALSGDRFDGHRFVGDAIARGASAVLVQEDRVPTECDGVGVIAVDDPRRALGRLAARYREDFILPLIAVGGSNGKTTVKELLTSVLRQQFRTLSSKASFNNDVGVPITLLELDSTHEVGVLEVGTNHPGELAPLVRMVKPRHGIITSIGREHLEFFGDLDGVVAEEGSLAEALPAGGSLYVNGDCPEMDGIERRTRARVIRVGSSDSSQWRVQKFQMHKTGVSFHVDAPDAAFGGDYSLNLLGRHQAVNALFAAAVGMELGLSRAALQRGLTDCSSPAMRLQLRAGHDCLVLDDSYNANEDSMRAAIRTLMDLPGEGDRVAVLGDMAELGQHTAAAHQAVGRCAAESGVASLYAVGRMAAVTAEGARQAGMDEVFEFDGVEQAGEALLDRVGSGAIVLVKGSRSCRLERLIEMLVGGKSRVAK